MRRGRRITPLAIRGRSTGICAEVELADLSRVVETALATKPCCFEPLGKPSCTVLNSRLMPASSLAASAACKTACKPPMSFGKSLSRAHLRRPCAFLTGKERDSESYNYYFGARYYFHGAARWLSVDPVAGHIDNPQRLNRYAYVLGDPLNRLDPDGADPVIIGYEENCVKTGTGGFVDGKWVVVNTTHCFKNPIYGIGLMEGAISHPSFINGMQAAAEAARKAALAQERGPKWANTLGPALENMWQKLVFNNKCNQFFGGAEGMAKIEGFLSKGFLRPDWSSGMPAAQGGFFAGTPGSGTGVIYLNAANGAPFIEGAGRYADAFNSKYGLHLGDADARVWILLHELAHAFVEGFKSGDNPATPEGKANQDANNAIIRENCF
jgi:RHS repeat-associated protein